MKTTIEAPERARHTVRPTSSIQWVDPRGEPTPDTNPAIGHARCLGYPVKSNPSYKPTPSPWRPICAEHLKRLPLDGRWEFRGTEEGAR